MIGELEFIISCDCQNAFGAICQKLSAYSRSLLIGFLAVFKPMNNYIYG